MALIFYAKQPNGNYCRFSTRIDTVTDINIPPEKIKQDAYILPFNNVKKYFLPNNHTIKEFEKILAEMGDENGFTEEERKSKKCRYTPPFRLKFH